ncbi:hypothetical protein GOC53_27940 [Sinorhizobium medicae]|nr:hypothetical protein [Sinorhizobium meliloti]ASP98404.1 hypothetical protein CDO24_13775 [Sinorhizobium meliloti]MDX0494055.1 hypothetical protein [Sinorhizobium medicae]MQV66149.1 hypothetical protein [Sinorhizobium meliloti]
MSIISVASGWQHILNEAVAEAQTLPQEWCFEITQAETVDGGLKLSATYVSGDVPLDDHLPAERKLPHPWRAMMRIRENAKQKSLVTCECCGREGRQIGAGEDARVRCVRHEDVIDVEQWEEKRASMRPMFETEEEAVEHFRQDYGKGVDMMRDLQTAVEQDSGEPDPKSKH